MRKKLALIFCIICLALPVFAEEEDGWAKYDNIDNAWDGQKIITNKEFEDTMKALEERKNKKMNKQKEKAIRKFKGKSLHDNMDVRKEKIESQTPLEEMEECQVINIPVEIGEKKDDGVYLELYQAHDLIAKIKAKETKDDFKQEYIQFVKLLPYNDSYMKLIFGSLDFNAYTYINIINTMSYNY